ncbi:hypothetical protein Peur_018283 [Populus x canadensis]
MQGWGWGSWVCRVSSSQPGYKDQARIRKNQAYISAAAREERGYKMQDLWAAITFASGSSRETHLSRQLSCNREFIRIT